MTHTPDTDRLVECMAKAMEANVEWATPEGRARAMEARRMKARAALSALCAELCVTEDELRRTWDLNGETHKLAALTERLQSAERVLKRVEWDDHEFCPDCGSGKPRHYDGCSLAAHFAKHGEKG